MLRTMLVCAVLLPSLALADDGGTAAFTWDTLRGAEWVEKDAPSNPLFQQEFAIPDADAEFELQFSEEVQKFSGRTVTLKGYMVPLQPAAKQQIFVLSKQPLAHCRFCQPGGTRTMLEVRAKEPIEFTYETVTIKGTLQLLEDDPMEMLYRLTEAEVAP